MGGAILRRRRRTSIVRIFDVDLRQTVSFGRTVAAAAKEPAAEQGFGPFNHVHDTVEWRTRAGKPFATIQRWFIADNEKPKADGSSDERADPRRDAPVARLPHRLHRRERERRRERARAACGRREGGGLQVRQGRGSDRRQARPRQRAGEALRLNPRAVAAAARAPGARKARYRSSPAVLPVI